MYYLKYISISREILKTGHKTNPDILCQNVLERRATTQEFTLLIRKMMA
jgi:hypothetical protein